MGILVVKHCEGSPLPSWCISRSGHFVFHYHVVPSNNELRVQHDEAWEDQDLTGRTKRIMQSLVTFLLRVSLLNPPHPGQFARFTSVNSEFVCEDWKILYQPHLGWGHMIISDRIPQQKHELSSYEDSVNQKLDSHRTKRIKGKNQHVGLKLLFVLKDKNLT